LDRTNNEMRKIAVLSDIHGNLVALKKVVADIVQRNVDLVLNLGDHISGPLWPKETLDYLRLQDWIQIRGNHERQILTQEIDTQGASDKYASRLLNPADIEWLEGLPERAEIGKEIVLFHGTPKNDSLYLLERVESGHTKLASPDTIKERLKDEKAPIILCGHTHIPRVVHVSENQMVVNPGSVGLPAYDDVEPEYHVVETGSAHARYAILEKDTENWRVELIALAYEHEKAAIQARKNKRMDWAIGLQSGFMRR